MVSSPQWAHKWAHLLKSNDPPLDTDIPLIRNFILERQTRLDAVKVQIENLRVPSKQLLLERDDIMDCIREHTMILAPIRRVPCDLLFEIFSLSSFTRHIDGEATDCPPWLLGHICKSWRDLALHSPFLWRRIEIPERSDEQPVHEICPSAMLKAQLSRSANVLLDISINWGAGDAHETTLLDLLMTCCRRWRTLRVHIWREDTTVLTRLRTIYGRVPHLENFEFIDRKNFYRDAQEERFLSLAPNLREIALTNFHLMGCSPRFLVPWAQITHYRGRCNVEAPLDNLSASPNLVDCGLALDEEFPLTTIIMVPDLRRLRVANCRLLDHLTTPSLTDLFLSEPFGLMSPMLAFVQRSSCRLTKLVLASCWPNCPDVWVDFFRVLPHLEYLMIHNCKLPDGFGEVMTISGAGSPADLCPNLEFLACHWHEDDELAMNSLCNMMQSRSHRPLTLCFFSDEFNAKPRREESLVAFVRDHPEFDVAVLSPEETSNLLENCWLR